MLFLNLFAVSMQFDMEAEEEKSLWKSWYFWWILLSTIFTFGWLFAAIALVVTEPRKIILVFEAWRWCIFFAGIMPIFWVSRLLIWMLIRVVEATLFRQWIALYFLAGTKVTSRIPPAPHPFLTGHSHLHRGGAHFALAKCSLYFLAGDRGAAL